MVTDKEKQKYPKPLAGILAKAIASFGLSKNYNGWMVVSSWEEIVGKDIAQHAKASRFEDGCLFVAVEDAAWRQQLSMSLEMILKKINSKPYGKTVKSIRLTHS